MFQRAKTWQKRFSWTCQLEFFDRWGPEYPPSAAAGKSGQSHWGETIANFKSISFINGASKEETLIFTNLIRTNMYLIDCACLLNYKK